LSPFEKSWTLQAVKFQKSVSRIEDIKHLSILKKYSHKLIFLEGKKLRKTQMTLKNDFESQIKKMFQRN
jgi:hypothetical protein